MSPLKRTPNGFTLIELLVVIAIISVAVSLLMPALSAAKAQSLRAQCVANLRELAQTCRIYADDDPIDIFGPILKDSKKFVREGYAHYGGGPGDMPYQDWDDPFDPRTRPFNWLIYGRDAIIKNTVPGDRRVYKLFQCPGDDYGWQEWPDMGTNPQDTERSYFFANGTAFRMNNLTNDRTVPRQTEVGSDPPVPPMSVGIYGRPMSMVPDTGRVVTLMEARAFQTQWTNDAWGELPPGELTGCHMKLGFFNLAYVDGHVDYMDMGDGTYFPQSERYDNLDVRGTWGSFDCFPSEPIPEP